MPNTGCPTVKLPVGIASGSPGAFGAFRVFQHSLAAGGTWAMKSDSKQESHQSSAKIDKETTSDTNWLLHIRTEFLKISYL